MFISKNFTQNKPLLCKFYKSIQDYDYFFIKPLKAVSRKVNIYTSYIAQNI